MIVSSLLVLHSMHLLSSSGRRKPSRGLLPYILCIVSISTFLLSFQVSLMIFWSLSAASSFSIISSKSASVTDILVSIPVAVLSVLSLIFLKSFPGGCNDLSQLFYLMTKWQNDKMTDDKSINFWVSLTLNKQRTNWKCDTFPTDMLSFSG